MSETLSKLQDFVAFALKNGASDADAYCVNDQSFSYGQRMGQPETIERSEGLGFSMRLYKGQKKQSFHASDLDSETIQDMITACLATLDNLPDDPYCGLANQDQIASNIPDMALADPQDPSEEQLQTLLAKAEEAALSHDKITNSKGGTIEWNRTHYDLVASNGFNGSYEKTTGSYYIQPVAGEGDGMQVDHDFSTTLFFNDLKDGQTLGQKAAQKTIAKLNPRKIKTGQYPVVFSKDVSSGLLAEFFGAIRGPNIARETSFLKNKKGQKLFQDGISIIDDPSLEKGLGSKPFDPEGLNLSKLGIVQDGVLETWIMDLVSARKLECQPLRGTSKKTNLYLDNGTISHDDLIADIQDGFYMTSVMSHPDTLINGDYNVGCSGFWIEKGQIAYPVHEVTLSGNLLSMFETLTPANDLSFDRFVNVPTLRVEGMTVAGE